MGKQQIFELLKRPKLHGDYMKEHILVPLCSFGNANLTKCDLFEEVGSFYYKDQVCYTFNSKGELKGQDIGPDSGLNFAINFRLPRTGPLQAPDLIIHPPGVLPDINHFSSSSFKIAPSTQYHVGVEATFTDVTQNFEEIGKMKRNCHLNTNEQKDYKSINCKMQYSMNQAKQKCNCLPWFLVRNQSDLVCNPDGFKCFETEMKLHTKVKPSTCPRECIYSKYDTKKEGIKITTKKTFDYITGIYGDEWKKYFENDNPGYISEGFHHSFTSQLWACTSLVHVNFGTPEATIITKDARVTIADMIGNIGGTFGVFLGLSFVSILDFLFQLQRWILSYCQNP